MCRCYIVYRFPNVQRIDSRRVTEDEMQKAKLIFQNFDKILSNDRGNQLRTDHSKTSRSQTKKNAEVTQTFVKKLFDDCVLKQRKMSELEAMREEMLKNAIHTAIDELTQPTEQKIR